MRRKIKFASAILSLVASMAILTFSVYAAAQKTATITTSVAFVGDRTNANVAVTYTAATSTVLTKDSTITTAASPANADITTANASFTIPAQTFTETARYFAIKILIKNNQTGMGLNVGHQAPAKPHTLVDVTAYKDGTAITQAATTKLAAGSTYTFVYIYYLNSQTGADFGAQTISLVFTLERVAA